jgi:hypothetical protein
MRKLLVVFSGVTVYGRFTVVEELPVGENGTSKVTALNKQTVSESSQK